LRHREDAEDVAQEAFAKAYRSFRQLRDRQRFRAWLVRMGTRVPVPTTKQPTVDGKSAADIPGFLTSPTSFTYQDIGTNIDCSAFVNDDGRFELTISIEDSSIREEKRNELPLIRMLRLSNQVVVLRDGQSTQFTAATDRISGEVVRVDVTLNVVK
jgi:hypothetical protein